MWRLFFLIILMFFGCQSANYDPSLARSSYPFERHSLQVVDVHVFRDGSQVVIAIGSDTHLESPRIWINQRYMFDSSDIKIGGTIVLDLGLFRDKFGESFSAGGFFAFREPEPLRLVQLETSLDTNLVQAITFRSPSESDALRRSRR